MSPFGSKHTLSRRVFGTVFTVAFAAIAVFTVVGSAFLQSNLAAVTRSELHDEAEIVAAALDSTTNDIAVLQRVEIENTRLTLIAEDGAVIYDNQEPAATMENHGQRPEVLQARETGHGSDERDSTTIGEVMLYEAVLLDNGQVIRIAQAQAGVLSILLSFVGPLLIIAAMVIVRLVLRGAPRVACHHRAPARRRPRPPQAQHGGRLRRDGAHARAHREPAPGAQAADARARRQRSHAARIHGKHHP